MSKKTEFLDKLILSDIPEIADTAKRSAEFYEMLERKEITKEEFDELIDDLVNIDNITKNMQALEVERQIVEAFRLIIQLKDLASLIP